LKRRIILPADPVGAVPDFRFPDAFTPDGGNGNQSAADCKRPQHTLSGSGFQGFSHDRICANQIIG
jgi:hypothetical protein